MTNNIVSTNLQTSLRLSKLINQKIIKKYLKLNVCRAQQQILRSAILRDLMIEGKISMKGHRLKSWSVRLSCWNGIKVSGNFTPTVW